MKFCEYCGSVDISSAARKSHKYSLQPMKIIEGRALLGSLNPGLYTLTDQCNNITNRFGTNFNVAKRSIHWISNEEGSISKTHPVMSVGSVMTNFSLGSKTDREMIEILPIESIPRASSYIYRGKRIDLSKLVTSGL